MSRRLGFTRRNTQFHIEAVVQECGLADIGTPNDCDIAGLSRSTHFSSTFARIASAAKRSASRFVRATPSPL